MRVIRGFIFFALVLFLASVLRAEYVVLRSGQRLSVTGYQIVGDKYRLQMNGGFVEVPVSEVLAIEPEEIFTPIIVPLKPAALGANAHFGQFIQSASRRFNVDADLISSVIAIESNYNPKAVSRKNARGLMQLIPGTASRLGVRNIFDPRENIDAGTRYLGELLHRYDNDLILALAAYNAGPQRVEKYGHVPPFPETMSYVRRVKRSYDQRKLPIPATPPAPVVLGPKLTPPT
ncbi:MAG: lytic transglycosylase domain-containing protein [Acidobacteriota bacterium]|nr:lytic transglycosylase domain-containing protein [Acidobacteriota bacterium]